MIAIVDYGVGNLFSIYNALNLIGGSPKVIREPREMAGADGVVVPGVGAFGKCMERLSRFEGDIRYALEEGLPVLGICIGMQVLFDASEESPRAQGFGWVKGTVVRLPEGVTVPQMGWNDISIKKPSGIMEGIEDGDMFYFVHSYHCLAKDPSVVVGTVTHGTEVAAVISIDNLSATQFHPEKSGQKGLKVLENFVRSTRC